MTLHHVGVVVDDIERHSRCYAQALEMLPRTGIIEDSVQKVRVQFWGAPGQVAVELIQPTTPDSPAHRALSKGGGLNHLGFHVGDIVECVAKAVADGAVCTCEPVRAAAFGGRRIAFVFYRHMGLIEFIERDLR
jgi:methylmalonyl-CoA/ethylmalonyl-CoA epimerase